MWFTWSFLGIMQIYTGRYLVHWWRWRLVTHVVLGSAIGILTIGGMSLIMKFLHLAFYFDYFHNAAG
jgi:hypothetical protein